MYGRRTEPQISSGYKSSLLEINLLSDEALMLDGLIGGKRPPMKELKICYPSHSMLVADCEALRPTAHDCGAW